jgi:hypothetical protein
MWKHKNKVFVQTNLYLIPEEQNLCFKKYFPAGLNNLMDKEHKVQLDNQSSEFKAR